MYGERILTSATNFQDDIVSFDDEMLILVNENDEEVGHLDKDTCHNGDGILHRAFSLFIFNDAGELLLQQRSPQKRLWPGYWSNSCCSHPRRGESMQLATQRRLEQELGLTADLQYIYKFQYQVNFDGSGSEHELCSVFLGKCNTPVNANVNEVAAWRFIDPAQLTQDLAANKEQFTPWFAMEWQRLTTEFSDELAKLTTIKEA